MLLYLEVLCKNVGMKCTVVSSIFVDLNKNHSFKDIRKFVDSDPVIAKCYYKLHFHEHLILWINSTTKSTRIGIQQILMKPHYSI